MSETVYAERQEHAHAFLTFQTVTLFSHYIYSHFKGAPRFEQNLSSKDPDLVKKVKIVR